MFYSAAANWTVGIFSYLDKISFYINISGINAYKHLVHTNVSLVNVTLYFFNKF